MKPVNLNQFKKQKARAEKRARADENAVKFGRSKTQKTLESDTAARDKRRLDGKKRDPQSD